jgi:predicted transglutaminase-like cysteine proteinase
MRLSLLLFPWLMIAAAPAAARTPTPVPAFMPVGGIADAPLGFSEMCAREPEQCAAGVVAAAPESLSAGSLKLLRRVNADVNRHVVQAEDLETTGMEDRWQRPNGVGDCEDLAIEKRARLIEQGFPADRLFLAVAFRRGFGLHTLLIARLDDGDRVLDSLSPHVMPWGKVGYRWLRQQSPVDPLVWRRVGEPLRMVGVQGLGVPGPDLPGLASARQDVAALDRVALGKWLRAAAGRLAPDPARAHEAYVDASKNVLVRLHRGNPV